MKVFIISFGPNPRIVAKFQTDRLRTIGENLSEKNKERKKHTRAPRRGVNHIRSAAATLRSAVAGGVPASMIGSLLITIIIPTIYGLAHPVQYDAAWSSINH